MLLAPAAITSGRFSIDVDPAVFGDLSEIHVFSASGDQQGVAKLKGRHADVVFGANSGGIGRLPRFPVAEITAPVLAAAPPGSVGAVSLQSPSPWRDASGKQYALSFQSAGVVIGAGMSIQSIAPGGGVLPAGTVVGINGQGFTASTRLTLEGVAWSKLEYVSPSLLRITLTGPSDLTGKLFEFADAGGASTRYYSKLTPASVQDDLSPSGLWPIFPAATYQTTSIARNNLWFENDTLSPIDVSISADAIICSPCKGLPLAPSRKITVPAGGVYLVYYDYSPPNSHPGQSARIEASAPIRVLAGFPLSQSDLSNLSPTAFSPPDSPANYNRPKTLDYRAGDPNPAPIPVEFYLPISAQAVTVVAGTDDGNPWLQASPVQAPAVAGGSTKFSVSIDASGLALGTHTGVATISYSGAQSGYFYQTFSINVHADATIAADVSGESFEVSSPFPRSITVTSTSASAPISVSSSDSWLTVTPTSATTPATITVSVAPLTPPNKTATITINGPGNSLVIPVSTYVGVGGFLFGDENILFTSKAGAAGLLTSSLNAASPFTFIVSTESGGSWLSAAAVPPSSGNSDWQLRIQADPAGLSVGIYRGTVTATATTATVFGQNPVAVSVTLSVWDDSAPPPVVLPGSVEFSQPPFSQMLQVSTGPQILPFSAAYLSDDAVLLQGLTAGNTGTPLYFGAFVAFPGTYHGSVTITAPPGSARSVTIPVTITSPSRPVVDPIRPRIAAIVNAGSLLPGSISPGEIVSVFGFVSSAGIAGLNIGGDGKVNREHYGIRVLFNRIAAPLTYVSAGQINAVVPYEISGSSIATVEVDGGGVYSLPWSVPVALSAPGLFTQNGSGQGDGAILNQDFSLNTAANPAARGSIVQIFLTGEGTTTPPGVTGEVTMLNTKRPTQAVAVQIGGVDAQVVSATTAPDAIAGLFQINALLPAQLPAGSVPVLIRIGNAPSQATATIYVK